jgi:hypothetical protein
MNKSIRQAAALSLLYLQRLRAGVVTAAALRARR